MASKIDIWNTSLSHIGHRATVQDPNESSVEANHCRRFYPIALDVALERYAWSVATMRAPLAEVENPVDHWAFAYALPNDCVKMRAVLPPECADDSMVQDFVIEAAADGTPILYTNMQDAVGRYTYRMTNTTRFTPMLVMTLSYDLAALLVGPIPKDPKLKQVMTNAAEYYVGLAGAADANAGRSSSYRDFIPSHMKVR